MTVYSVYEPPGDADLAARADKVSFVKDGFSWLALFVPILWLIYQRMWLELFVFLAVFASLPWLFGNDPAMKAVVGWVSFGLTLVFAFEANDIRGWALRRRGFTLAGTARGRDREEAEASFFTRWLPRQERPRQEQVRSVVAPALPNPAKRTASAQAYGSARDEVIGSFPRG